MLLAGSILWILLILAAPYLSIHNLGAGGYLYLFFSGVCHQEADRCFMYHGQPLAVCARCFGIYIGFIPGLLASGFIPRIRNFLLNNPRIILVFMLPMILDVLLPNTHWSRFFTGMAASFPVAVFVHQAVEQIQVNLIRRTVS